MSAQTEARAKIAQLQKEINKAVIGQRDMVDKILMGLLAGGHILLEGVPGLAKTLTASAVAKALGVTFRRIQFTPDLLPADIVGTEIYQQQTGAFVIKKGPIFSHFILADEINRSPAKVQSALLEAMQERQVSIGDATYPLAAPFIVIATQNPLEQHGTYPLPEAQQDRFLFKLKIEYPAREEERGIVAQYARQNKAMEDIAPVVSREDIFAMQACADEIHVDPRIVEYVLDLVFATRKPSPYIVCGASPRASINLVRAAKARAFLQARDFVSPDDVKALSYDVLRHRIILSYEAEAEGITPEALIEDVLESIHLP